MSPVVTTTRCGTTGQGARTWWILIRALAFATAVLAGGCGTVVTRLTLRGRHAHPYAAAVEDFEFMAKARWIELAYTDVKVGGELGLLSLPLDLAIDTLLLPIDLVRWLWPRPAPQRRPEAEVQGG